MKGFTLIEVMISLFILLAGMSGVIKLQVTSAAITKLSADLTVAQNLAQTILQTELARPITQVITTGKNSFNQEVASSTTGCLVASDTKIIKGVTYNLTCDMTLNSSPQLASKAIGTDTEPAVFVSVVVTWVDLLNSGDALSNHRLDAHGMIIIK